MDRLLYPRPPILDEIPRDCHAVLEASAGTGKTFTLKHLLVELLLDGRVTIDQLLVVTFTRRATAELEVQVRGILTDMLRAFDEQDDEGLSEDDDVWLLGRVHKRRIKDALNSFDQAQIYTIHSFCQHLLTEHAFENHQLFDGEKVDAEWLFEQCFYDVLRKEYANHHRRLMEAWLEVAGANPVPGLRKALFALEKNTQGLLPAHTDAILRPQVDKGRLETLLRRVEANEVLEKSQIRELKAGIVARFHEAVRDAVARRKRTEGLYTFQDMLSIVYDSLGCGESNDGGNMFLKAVRQQYKYALVDEFQDTDQLQWGIFREIFLESDLSNICYLIGDPKQSIYSFRGADVWTYVAARDEVEKRYGPESVITLGDNYRSTAALIEAYDNIFAGEGEPAFFDGDLPIRYSGVNCGNPEQSAYRRGTNESVKPIELLELDVSDSGTPGIGTVRKAYASAIASRIQALLNGDDQLECVEDENAPRKPLEPGDIYVLTRRNADAETVGEELRAHGIPFAFYKQDGLLQRPEARDIHWLLRAVAEPWKRAWRRAAYLTPFFAIPLEELADQDELDGDGWSPRKLLQTWNKHAEALNFERLFDSILTNSGIIRRELLLSDSERRLTNYRHIFELLLNEASRRDLDIRQLVGRLKALREERESTDEQDGNTQRLESDRSAVQVMTMHKSKGLQAQVVFLHDFSSAPGYNVAYRRRDGQKIFALHSAALNKEQKAELSEYRRQEAQRLHYVGITRAKSKLYLPFVDAEVTKVRKYPIGHVMKCIDRAIEADPDGAHFSRTRFTMDDVATAEPSERDWKHELAELSLPEWVVKSEGERTVFAEWKPNDKTPADVEDIFGQLRKKTVSMTSYTGLKASKSTSTAAPPSAPETDADPFELPEGALPGGTRAGSYLHEILEYIDYPPALDAASAREWAARPEIAQVIEQVSAKFGYDGQRPLDCQRRAYTAQILYRTLRTSITGHDGESFRIAELPMDSLAKEVRFVFPAPQDDAFQLGTAPTPDVEIRRGYLKGFIDLLFRDDAGRVYFADWKSDTPRGGFSPDIVDAHVEYKYPLQARIYTMAVCRMFDLTNEDDYHATFGGFYYFFVRGMNDGSDHGIYYGKPSWHEVLAVERALESCDDAAWQDTLGQPQDTLMQPEVAT